TARQSSSRAAAPVSTARPIKTVAPKPFVNVAKSRPNAFQKSHSPSRRSFYQQTALKNRNLNNKVNTIKVKSINTAKGKRVTSAFGEQGLELKVLVVYHTTNGHQFTMSNRQERIGYSRANDNWYALTTNLTIYVSLIKQFWQTSTVKSVNDGEQQITVTVDGHTFAITEASVRRHLQLADADGISLLPNTEIFEQLTLIGPKKTSWEQFSSNIAIAVICLATNRTFNFSKLIFDGMVKNVDSKTKFLMYPRFIQMLLNKKKKLLKQHKKTYVAPMLTRKPFSNMKIGFSGEHTPLFDTMLPHDQPGQGEGSTLFVESQHTPIASPTTSQPTTTQPTSSQEQPSHIPITAPIPTTSSPPLHETTFPQTTSSMPMIHLSQETKKVYGKAITKLVKKVKHLEDRLKSTKARRKAKLVISDEEEDLVLEDPSKQGRLSDTEYKEAEYDLDQTDTLQEITPTKAIQKEEHNQETSEVQLDVLSAAKILAEASRERVKTYNRRRRSADSSRDSTTGGLFSTAEEILSTDERIAQKLNEEKLAKAATRKEQERIDFEKA
ncbi:hypothetical protein Tco_1373565, partial [Tanacetum coccineum]